MAATGLLYLAILTAFGTDIVARAVLRPVLTGDGQEFGGCTWTHARRSRAAVCETWCGCHDPSERHDLFGLVSIPVKLFNAVRRQSISFNQLDGRDLQRIRYRKVNGETGDEVHDDDIVKGYEVSKGRYIIVDPDELEPFMPVATKSIDLEEFVDLGEIDPVYFDSAYFVAPDNNPKPYVLLARAMAESGKVAIGRFVMRNKQYTAAIRAEDGRLVMSSLVYADEVVDPASIDELHGLDDIEVNAREVAMAESLVESLTAEFEPAKYHDEYREQVLALSG